MGTKHDTANRLTRQLFAPQARRRQLEHGRRILQLLSWSTCCFTLTIWSPRASSATSEMLIRECMQLFYDNKMQLHKRCKQSTSQPLCSTSTKLNYNNNGMLPLGQTMPSLIQQGDGPATKMRWQKEQQKLFMQFWFL